MANEPARDRTPAARRRDVVELVDGAAARALQTRDVDLERAVEGLGRRERLAVDLHYFVGLDLATVAEVMHGAPGDGRGSPGPSPGAAGAGSSGTTTRT